MKDVSKVKRPYVKRSHTVKSMQNPSNIQHRCSQCFRCFQGASQLHRHEMLHTGLKPFTCPTCGKAFRKTSHMKGHCKEKLSNPENQQEDVRKLLYPKIIVCIPTQEKSVNTDNTHSVYDGAVSNREGVLFCTGTKISVTE